MPTSLQIKAALIALMCIGLIGVGWMSRGWYDNSQILKDANQQLKNTLQIEHSDQTKGQTIATAHAVKQQAVASQASAVTKEIIRYVQAPRATCKPDPDWVRIHRQATSGVPAAPPTASGANAASQTDGQSVSDIDVLTVDAENALRFKQNFEQCSALQAFIKATTEP